MIALDLPGHGASPDPEPMSWVRFASGVIAAMDYLGLERPHVFGYSLGAGVALEVARQRPVARLALHATSTQWTPREVGIMTDGLTNMPQHVQTHLADLHGGLWREVVAQMTDFAERLPGDWITDAMLAEVSAPTLVSIGDRDALFSVEQALHLARVLPDAALSVLPGVDHNLSTLDADAFARGVAAHLLSS